MLDINCIPLVFQGFLSYIPQYDEGPKLKRRVSVIGFYDPRRSVSSDRSMNDYSLMTGFPSLYFTVALRCLLLKPFCLRS